MSLVWWDSNIKNRCISCLREATYRCDTCKYYICRFCDDEDDGVDDKVSIIYHRRSSLNHNDTDYTYYACCDSCCTSGCDPDDCNPDFVHPLGWW